MSIVGKLLPKFGFKVYLMAVVLAPARLEGDFLYSCRELDDFSFHKLSDATLDELAEFFEDLGDSGLCSGEYDVSLAVSSQHVV